MDRTEFERLLDLHDRAIETSKKKYDDDLLAKKKFLKNCPHYYREVMTYSWYVPGEPGYHIYWKMCDICGNQYKDREEMFFNGKNLV